MMTPSTTTGQAPFVAEHFVAGNNKCKQCGNVLYVHGGGKPFHDLECTNSECRKIYEVKSLGRLGNFDKKHGEIQKILENFAWTVNLGSLSGFKDACLKPSNFDGIYIIWYQKIYSTSSHDNEKTFAQVFDTCLFLGIETIQQCVKDPTSLVTFKVKECNKKMVMTVQPDAIHLFEKVELTRNLRSSTNRQRSIQMDMDGATLIEYMTRRETLKCKHMARKHERGAVKQERKKKKKIEKIVDAARTLTTMQEI